VSYSWNCNIRRIWWWDQVELILHAETARIKETIQRSQKRIITGYLVIGQEMVRCIDYLHCRIGFELSTILFALGNFFNTSES